MSSLIFGSIPYYKINKILWTWTLYDGEDGCHIVRDTVLSLNKAPPALRDQPKPPPKPPARWPTPEERRANTFAVISSFKKWLDSSDPPVIPPLLTRDRSRDYAAAMSLCFGVIPPRPMLGRS